MVIHTVHREYLANIRESCHAFFMEVVSTLCFGSQTSPEPELINTLIGMVFTEEAGTKELSPYKEVKNDDVPVVRSFLLQLLLEHELVLVLTRVILFYVHISKDACESYIVLSW